MSVACFEIVSFEVVSDGFVGLLSLSGVVVCFFFCRGTSVCLSGDRQFGNVIPKNNASGGRADSSLFLVKHLPS